MTVHRSRSFFTEPRKGLPRMRNVSRIGTRGASRALYGDRGEGLRTETPTG